MQIILIRHGQTTGDTENRYGGDYDDHLPPEGHAQVARLASELINQGIEIIFCSPKIRAQETAKHLIEKIHCPLETLTDLRERNQYGILTGMIKEEAALHFPDLVTQVKDYRNTISGAESYENAFSRVVTVWGQIVTKPYSAIAVLTHGGPIRILFRHLFNNQEIDVADCAYATLDVVDGKATIVSLTGIKLR